MGKQKNKQRAKYRLKKEVDWVKKQLMEDLGLDNLPGETEENKDVNENKKS